MVACAADELARVAVRAGGQLRVHAAAVPLAVCQHCVDWMEQLPELCQQQVDV